MDRTAISSGSPRKDGANPSQRFPVARTHIGRKYRNRFVSFGQPARPSFQTRRFFFTNAVIPAAKADRASSIHTLSQPKLPRIGAMTIQYAAIHSTAKRIPRSSYSFRILFSFPGGEHLLRDPDLRRHNDLSFYNV